MGIIAAGQITVVDLSDAPVLNAFITASRPTTQTYSKDSRNYNPSYASTPQVLTLNVTKAGSTTSIIGSISGLRWFVVDGSAKTEITSRVNTTNEYISGTYDENLTTKLNIDTNKGYRRYEATGVWRDPSTGLDVQFSADIDLLLTQNGATGPQGPQGDDGPQGPQGDKGETGNGIANTVVTYGLSMSDTTEPATWSSDRPALVKGMYLWTRTVIIYTNGESSTSYQISYIPKDGDATGEIDKTKQELLEKLETVRDDSLAAVEEAKEQLETVRDDSLAAAEEAKQQVTTVANELNTAKQDFQNAVSAVDTKATNLQNDLSQAKQDLASQAQQLQEQATAQSELTKRVSSVEETANGTKTTVSELSKTVDQNGKDITSVTARTKVVEDDLAGTKITLSQVKMTADSTSQKTATLETGLSGLSARFDSLSVGNKNYLPASRVANRGCSNFSYSNTTKSWTMTAPASSTAFGNGITFNTNGLNILLNGGETLFFGLMIKTNKACSFNYDVNNALSGSSSNDNDDTSKRACSPSNKSIPANVWTKVWFSYTAKANVPITEYNSNFGIVNNTEPVTIEIKEVMVAKSNVPVDYQTPDTELEQKIAEYKQNADQNYASLQSTVQNLDGTVQHNKTIADQTAQGFTTRIESLETYKDGESTRANRYFELAKNETARQLTVERTAIAKDYVAKSTYISDVTGIRNELSATTTTANTIKTNLANYQASNDRAVASLQSNVQTANGDIRSLKTKVEAVPGQITSAVSAVESKIPTSVGARNYIRNYGLTATGWTFNKAGWKIEIISDNTAKSGQYLKATCTTASTSGGGFYKNLFDFSDGRFFGKQMTWSMDVKLSKAKSVKIGPEWGYAYLDFNATTEWKRYSKTFTVATTTEYNQWIIYTNDNVWNVGDIVYIRDVQLEDGSIATTPVPAIEDTQSDISTLSSQIKQTADGITLLATKTELNTAKNELQSGIKTATDKANSNAQTISTHTTQISALNTGLNAKVSQSDFNTLSGRVTTAENNITAKANELSSKISSVEGKIPTDIGMVNLFKGSRDFSGSWTTNTGVYAEDYQGVKIFKTQDLWGGRSQYFEVKTGEEYVFSAYVKSSAKTDGVNFYLVHNSKQPMASGLVSFDSDNRQDYVNIGLTDKYKRIAVKIKITKNGWMAPRIERYNSDAYLFFGGYKLERGNISTNWSPASEDYDTNLASLEGKIPTNLDSLNLMTGTRDWSTKANKWHMGANWSTESGEYQGLKVHSTKYGWNGSHQNIFVKNGDVITFSFFAKANSTLSNIKVSSRWTDSSVYQAPLAGVKESDEQITITSEWKRYSKTIHITSDGSLQFRTEYDGSTIPNGNTFYVAGLKLAKSSLDTGYSENPIDIASDITKLDTTLTQTADGLKQLSTKVTSQGGTITSHTNSINSLTTGLQAKVSQSDFNTLSGRVTTAENNIIAKANELSSKITSVEGKIPKSASQRNLVQGTSVAWSPFVNITTNTNWCYNLATVDYGDKTGIYAGSTINIFVYLSADEITLSGSSPRIFIQGEIIDKSGNVTWTNWDKYHPFRNKWSSSLTSGNNYRIVKLSAKVSNDSYSNINGFRIGIRIDGVQSGKFHHRALMVTTGDVFPDSWSAAPEDTINQISSLSSEFKQTTDSIKASVTSLNNSTVKSSSLTINSDGIVMKAGKSTTDVANAIGSYFAVNQNAINLFADKIKVKGNMIVSGSISSDKIAASGITANVIKGGTLQSTNGSTNFELNTGKLFYNNNNTGVFRIQNGASTMGLKFSNTPVTVSGTSRILSRVIIGGDRNETSLDDGKWDKGGFSGLVIETIKGAIPAVNEHADSLRAISDTIYFTHTYSADSPTGVSAHGWKMETYAPDSSYSGNIVLKPYGINYRQSDIVVGDVRLDNGDGTGYWMRATINTLKACFGHILNGGTSSQALNAIRSELNKISGT